jgi:hypothetical protein
MFRNYFQEKNPHHFPPPEEGNASGKKYGKFNGLKFSLSL